jgi:histidinol-phosphate aminotransferase
MKSPAQRIHGGPDERGAVKHDFSTNSNACGPCPVSALAISGADATRYPDPSYRVVRQQLADFHSVEYFRIVLAASASEFIFRLSAWLALSSKYGQSSRARVFVPPLAYGDYGYAAQAWGLELVNDCNCANLVWACDPSSPLGQSLGAWPQWLSRPEGPAHSLGQHVVLDGAYAPLRLEGASALNAIQRSVVWQLFTPNKALGLTGIRAAYAIAPVHAEEDAKALEERCASWPIGAHGVAMLQTWASREAQSWVAESRLILAAWKIRQINILASLGWKCLPSTTNFFCAQPPTSFEIDTLRGCGIKLRDTRSLGLPGYVRLGVLPPASQDVLKFALSNGGRQ